MGACLVLARGKKLRETRKMRDSQQTLRASLWRESLELYYQTSTATTQPKVNTQYRFFSSASLSPHPPCFPCHPLLSHISDSQHPNSPLLDQPSDCLLYLLTNVVMESATHLWITAFRLNLYLATWQGEREGQNGKDKGYRGRQNRGDRGGGEKSWVSQKTYHSEVFTKRKERQPGEE